VAGVLASTKAGRTSSWYTLKVGVAADAAEPITTVANVAANAVINFFMVVLQIGVKK
jgi:hypothetical protein